MKPVAKTLVPLSALLTSALLLSACASDPAPTRDPYNDADSQRTRAKQSQDELSNDTRKNY